MYVGCSRNVAVVIMVAVVDVVAVGGDKNSYKQITMPPPMAMAMSWASS